MRVIGYVREGVQGGPPLDVQEQEIRDAARWAEWNLVRIIEDDKGQMRPGLASAICELSSGTADAIVVARRKVMGSYRHVLLNVQRIRPMGRLLVLDENFNSDQPGAEEWLRARLALDTRPRPEPRYPPELIERVQMERAAGMTYVEIAAGLNFDGISRLRGGGWSPADVRQLWARAHAAETESTALSD